MTAIPREPAQEREYMLDCLARWICDRPSLDARRKALEALEANHGAAFVDGLQRRVKREWKNRQANAAGEDRGAQSSTADR